MDVGSHLRDDLTKIHSTKLSFKVYNCCTLAMYGDRARIHAYQQA